MRFLFSFFGLFLFWSLSLLFPFRKMQKEMRWRRWSGNLFFILFNATIVKVVAPLTLIEISQRASFLNFTLPFWVKLSLGVLVLDLIIYWQHRLFHRIPLLWRLHRVHHSDVEMDTTTAGRFHTLEIIFSFAIKSFFVWVFPIPFQAVLIFEIVLNFSSLFNHSNFEFPHRVERWLQYLLITPHLHRIHHSTRGDEMSRNFGFSISLWDFLFKSLKKESRGNPRNMPIGLRQWRASEDQVLWRLLLNPFSNQKQNETNNNS